MQAIGPSYRFGHAILRKPGDSAVRGLRVVDRGAPDIRLFLAEHAAYADALCRAGLAITVLDPLEAFPDAVFLEDAALCLPQGTVLLNPGTASRSGETKPLAAELGALGHDLHRLEPPGRIDGGDILVTGSEILVGLSARTDKAGFDALDSLLAGWGYRLRKVHTPEGVLHFKSDCSLLDGETILATDRLGSSGCLSGFRLLTVPAGEEAAANSIRVNERVLVPEGFPATVEMLQRENYSVETVPVSQAALLDAGLSCMSLRF
jgi:dimethylargininase